MLETGKFRSEWPIPRVIVGICAAGLVALYAVVRWEPQQLFSVISPWVLAVCCAFLVVIAWMAARLQQLARNLEVMQSVAMTDHLTGAANRAALASLIHTPKMQAALQKGRCAVLSIDLDDFKRLNDECGHGAGDAALRGAADRIARSLPPGHKVYRTGGDEFLCVLFSTDSEAAAETVVKRLTDSFAVPMPLGGDCRKVTPSIGVAIAQPGDSWDAVSHRADVAMYSAKRKDAPHSSGSALPADFVATEIRKPKGGPGVSIISPQISGRRQTHIKW